MLCMPIKLIVTTTDSACTCTHVVSIMLLLTTNDNDTIIISNIIRAKRVSVLLIITEQGEAAVVSNF